MFEISETGYFLRRFIRLGGEVASWLVRSSPDRAIWVRVLAGDIALCSWARHFTPTTPLSTQVYKWLPANLTLGVTLRWTSITYRGEKKYSLSFLTLHATETRISRISSGLMGYLARMQTYLPTSPHLTVRLKELR